MPSHRVPSGSIDCVLHNAARRPYQLHVVELINHLVVRLGHIDNEKFKNELSHLVSSLCKRPLVRTGGPANSL
jgi:hypothetical protein